MVGLGRVAKLSTWPLKKLNEASGSVELEGVNRCGKLGAGRRRLEGVEFARHILGGGRRRRGR